MKQYLPFSRSIIHRGFPVVDNGKLVGIITQTDLVKCAIADLAGDTRLARS
jgi:CIC family chloride channel protein